MDKLLNLLNEYGKTLAKGTRIPAGNYKDIEKNKLLIISREYEFIKWLVDNDKINFNFVERVGSGDFIYDMNSPYYNSCTCEDLEEYGDVDRVLMLLAIQDKPIEFLISILK